MYTIIQVETAFKSKNYKLLTRPYELNVLGIRSNLPASNKFDDWLGAYWRDYGGTPYLALFPGTTDPGFFWLNQPSNVAGTAIVVPGQYIGSHKLGLHKGQYKALVQASPIKVYRDNNKDYIYDMDESKINSGIFGINIHRANAQHASTQIDQWSAGCQVFADPKDFDQFLTYCDMHESNYGNLFNYTLFTQSEMK